MDLQINNKIKMKRLTVIAFCLLLGTTVFGQKMITRTGEIKFEATMPGIEEIAATNKTGSCILDEATGDFVVLALIKAFKFKAPLMEEHFNENYMESTQFPKATFKGKIIGFDTSKLSATQTYYDIDGELTMHGVTKKIKTKVSLSLKDGKIHATGNLSAKPQDYKIEIPNLVKDKIAENVKIEYTFVLEAK